MAFQDEFINIDLEDELIGDETIRRLQTVLDDVVLAVESLERGVIEQAAINITYDRLVEDGLAIAFLAKEAQIAIVKNEEFNYGPYPQILQEAILNSAEINFTLSNPMEGVYPKVEHCEVLMRNLGSYTEWYEICNASSKKIAETPIAKLKWYEIYMVGRKRAKLTRVKIKNKKGGSTYLLNGVTIYSASAGGLSKDADTIASSKDFMHQAKRSEKEGITEITDLTEKFKEHYQNIMERRAENIPSGQAPFWQLIENGNPSDIFPTKPTNFVREAEMKLRKSVEAALIKNCDMLRNMVDEASLGKYGITGYTAKSKALYELTDRSIYEALSGREEEIKNLPVWGVLDEINGMATVKYPSGRIGNQYRLKGAGGRFVKRS